MIHLTGNDGVSSSKRSVNSKSAAIQRKGKATPAK